jgi:hypothetical protein
MRSSVVMTGFNPWLDPCSQDSLKKVISPGLQQIRNAGTIRLAAIVLAMTDSDGPFTVAKSPTDPS